MAFTTSSTFMLLPVPQVGVDPGPQYATDVNSCLTIIDQHNHLPGAGVPIVSAALNINADVQFNVNNAIGLRATRFQPQTATIPATGVDVGELFVAGVDLYYNDASGNQIRLTQSGGVAGTPGSIANLIAPASVTYVPLTGTYVFQSAANTAGNIDAAAITLRNMTTNGKGVTLQPINALGADYSITLPALPSVQSIVTMDALGNMLAQWTPDNSTITVVSNQLTVQPSAIAPAIAAAIVDNVTIQEASGIISVRHGDREHNYELNGSYAALTYPLTNIDAIFFAPYNLTITSVWIYNGDAGTGGTTEFDLKVASSGGSFTSILSTTGQITSAASSTIWTDSGSIIGTQTGVTKPVLSTTAITAGQAIRFDLIQSMSGSPTDARIRIFYKQS